MNVTSGDFFIFTVVEDDITVFEEEIGLSSDFVIRSKEGFEVGFVDSELIFGGVFEDKGVDGGDVEDNTGFLGDVFAVGLTLSDVVNDGGNAGHL
jgi:hypothetical protein